MEIKTKGIVIGNRDSGDKDKIVTIFCLNKGVVQAKLKGVKNPNAVLKFAKEPFCFAEFVFIQTGDFFTIKSAECIDSFYELSKNYQAFTVASEILKMITRFPTRHEYNKLFLETIKSLKVLSYEKVDEKVVFIKFLLGLFYSEGYEFSHNHCTSCGTLLGENRWLDLNSGEVLCASCKTSFCVRISFAQSSLLKVVSQTDYDKLSSLHIDMLNLENTLSILKKNFERKVG